ncbi:sulfotransferase [Roseospirillum parvum]|uniref:Sulfotransferase family protein n=1 Tax=Roseospirillum parvum TaxID=83401 RepID=A0A1G7WLS1_9PROT|nr:sulfotransferase [Roseospirillum parvum]SDG72975.1 Sulfotransferase family protein [Roseospirillum parvum]
MLAVMGDVVGRGAALVGAAFRAPPGRRRPSVRRVVTMAVFLPAFLLVQAVHGLCLLLDEVLFPAYRKVKVNDPLIVLGVPRSGTTMVHRALARDPNLTTFSTWECLLAPSIIQRRAVFALGRLDARLGRPLGRLLAWVEGHLFARLDDVHAMDLSAPEEDYLALLPVLACFILVVPFPTAEPLWRLARADRDLPEGQRRRLMAFYRRLLQRHLFVHGPDKRLLSKNAAFAGSAATLKETFPEARFLVCLRRPDKVVPSQLSAIADGVRLFAGDPDETLFPARMPELLADYYHALLAALPPEGGPRHRVFAMEALKNDLAGTLKGAYRDLGLPLEDAFAAALDEEAAAARAYRSRHAYRPPGPALDPESIDARFAPVYQRLDAAGLLAVPPRPKEA